MMEELKKLLVEEIVKKRWILEKAQEHEGHSKEFSLQGEVRNPVRRDELDY